jgi:hypothetical protein
MGSQTAWHLLTAGLQFAALIAVIVGIAWVVRRKTPDVSGGAFDIKAVPDGTPTQKVIALAYLLGGAFGAFVLLPKFNAATSDFLAALAWSILLGQVVVAIYGGWQFWRQQPIGAQLLYWLSWSCVPAISFSVFSYRCAMGLALLPTVSLGPGNFSADFSLRFGYASKLWFDTGDVDLLLGVNLIAVLFVYLLAQHLRQIGVPIWPLQRPDR